MGEIPTDPGNIAVGETTTVDLGATLRVTRNPLPQNEDTVTATHRTLQRMVFHAENRVSLCSAKSAVSLSLKFTKRDSAGRAQRSETLSKNPLIRLIGIYSRSTLLLIETVAEVIGICWFLSIQAGRVSAGASLGRISEL